MADFICTILLGWLGTYRFSKGQTSLGFVYMFTFGLFGIGWLVDICLSYKEIDFDSIRRNNYKSDISIKEDDSQSKKFECGWALEQKVSLDSNSYEKIKNKYISIDLKVSGYNPNIDRIVEIAVAVFENGKMIKKCSTLVNPGSRISKEATMIHNITNKMVKKAPDERNVFMQLMEFINDAMYGDTYICIHDSKKDMQFLSNTLERLGYKCKLVYIDTAEFSKKIIENLEDYSLYAVAEHLGIEYEKKYRSEYDSEVVGEILWSLLNLER